MIQADALSLQEYIVQEPLPLAKIHQAIFDWLQHVDDVVVFGAHAVNAYVGEPRMTQDIDLLSSRADELAEQLRRYLNATLFIAVRVRQVAGGKGFRLFQIRKEGNRHLVDIRQVAYLPPAYRIENVPIIAPAELLVSKVIGYTRRRGKPKAGTDWRDIALLLLTFPELRRLDGEVQQKLLESGADEAVLAEWTGFVAAEIEPESDDDEFW